MQAKETRKNHHNNNNTALEFYAIRCCERVEPAAFLFAPFYYLREQMKKQ